MEKPFKFRVGDEQYKAKVGNCVVCLFRTQPEIDYFKVLRKKEENSIYVFNNQELARHLGGFVLQGDFDALPTHYPDKEFRATHGWNAPVIIEDIARQYEIDLYIEANANTLDSERPEWL